MTSSQFVSTLYRRIPNRLFARSENWPNKNERNEEKYIYKKKEKIGRKKKKEEQTIAWT